MKAYSCVIYILYYGNSKLNKVIMSFQAGEFFHTAQTSAIEQQREYESRQVGEASLDTPLMMEQV